MTEHRIGYDDPILASLLPKEGEFYTQPFLSSPWGGVDCYNVPQSKLYDLQTAFETLSGVFPVSYVKGRYVDERGNTGYLYRLTRAEATGVVVSGDALIRQADGSILRIEPEGGVWQQAELSKE